MILYCVFMFVMAAVFAVLAMLISNGNTNLINCYHEDRVIDKPTYCKKFGQSLWILTAALVASGVVGLFGETDAIALCAVGVLVAGIVYGSSRLFYVQKKYGGGVF